MVNSMIAGSIYLIKAAHVRFFWHRLYLSIVCKVQFPIAIGFNRVNKYMFSIVYFTGYKINFRLYCGALWGMIFNRHRHRTETDTRLYFTGNLHPLLIDFSNWYNILFSMVSIFYKNDSSDISLVEFDDKIK